MKYLALCFPGLQNISLGKQIMPRKTTVNWLFNDI